MVTNFKCASKFWGSRFASVNFPTREYIQNFCSRNFSRTKSLEFMTQKQLILLTDSYSNVEYCKAVRVERMVEMYVICGFRNWFHCFRRRKNTLLINCVWSRDCMDNQRMNESCVIDQRISSSLKKKTTKKAKFGIKVEIKYNARKETCVALFVQVILNWFEL